MSGASLGGLDPAGWKYNEAGEIDNEELQRKDDHNGAALFKHAQSLEAEDVLRMKVVRGGNAAVGFAAEKYNVERPYALGFAATHKRVAYVTISNGTTVIGSDISKDGERHCHPFLLEDHIPKTLPYDLALRINKDGNMPQLRFNEDGQWNDFVPEGETGLKAGPWFPFLELSCDARLSEHRVNRPRPVKGAGMYKSLAASATPASGSADVAAVDGGDLFLPPQKKARHDEAGGSK